MKGNCCAGRDRSVDLMVTTAGETRLTKSAYEFCKPTGAGAEFETAGCEGCSGAKLITRLCPLHAVTEKATSTRLKRIFMREFAPLKLPILFIASLFLESSSFNTKRHSQAAPTHRPAKSPQEFRGFSTPGETTNTVLGFSERLFRLLMCYTPAFKNPAIPWVFFVHTNADHLLISQPNSRTSPICPT
jgi:hypothetical protein